MSDGHEPVGLDQRIQDYFDGELSASDAAAFEADLRTDAGLSNRVAALRGMAIWFRSTRNAAPSLLASTVERALEAERDSAVESSSGPLQLVPDHPAGEASGHPWRTWVTSTLAAAAVLAVVLLTVQGRFGDADSRFQASTDPTATSSASAEDANTVRYTFQYRASKAEQICLAGDFNHWKVCDTELTRVGEDLWTIALELPPGRHEYMFVVDGHWLSDPGATLYSDDGFGNKNAVINL